MTGILPARKDKDGYWRPARSQCCYARVVHYDRRVNFFVPWDGLPGEDVPAELRCGRCNKKLEAK